ncbi:hypothetical protein O9929_06090 [Vibrio lentus]|nr:hypothetical protein [Vibrio lentus]
MTKCNDAVRVNWLAMARSYRATLKSLRTLLNNTLEVLDAKLHDAEVPKKETLQNIDQLWTPLYACY